MTGVTETEVGDGLIQYSSNIVLIVNDHFQGIELKTQEEIQELISILEDIELKDE